MNLEGGKGETSGRAASKNDETPEKEGRKVGESFGVNMQTHRRNSWKGKRVVWFGRVSVCPCILSTFKCANI